MQRLLIEILRDEVDRHGEIVTTARVVGDHASLVAAEMIRDSYNRIIDRLEHTMLLDGTN